MYLNVYTILVILSCQCLLTSSAFVKSANRPDSHNYCHVYVSPTDYTMPVPFTFDYRSKVITPDMNGYLHFEKNKTIQLSCTFNEFLLPYMNNEREISVTCIEGDKFMYNGRMFNYHDFLCKVIPVSRLVVTSHKCQFNASVAAVGFQTKKRFFLLYNICFDVEKKNPLYTWYFVNTPHKTNRQTYPMRPDFIKTRQFYDHIDVHSLYKKQSVAMLKAFGSKQLVNKYLIPKRSYFLARGHLVSRTEFYYGFEQEATFYYENTTPTWQKFNKDLWRHIEAYLSLRMSAGSGQHLVVTGTYGICTLPDVNNVSRPLYIKHPDQIPVPQYIWKMDFDTSGKHKPVVFIGLNNPFIKDFDESVYICKTMPCPIVVQNIIRSAASGLVYCCSKKSFERTYGRFKSIIFHKNLI